MNLQHEIDKLIAKIIVGLAEASLVIIISILSLLASVVMFFARQYIYTFVSFFGINYFKERNFVIRDINSDLIWTMGALHANSYGLFRTFNGRAYVIENGLKHTKITVKKINSKPVEFFPEYLTLDIYKELIAISIMNDWQLISYEGLKGVNPTSHLLVFLEENGIDHLLSYRIWDLDKVNFGFIIFTWNKRPDLEYLFSNEVSKKLDSISIRYQNYIVSSVIEKIFNWRILK